MANGIVLNIDTTKSEFQNPMIELRQGDGNYQSLDVTVTSNGEPFNLTGWTITFMGTTAGGFKIVDTLVSNVDTANGKFTYTPTKSWGQDEGMFKEAYFKFTSGANGNSVASGASIRVNVLTAVDLTAEEAGDYISIVDQTIATLNEDLTTLQLSVDQLKAQNNAIKTTDNTWTGTNTFNKKIIAPAGIQGNADTATKLQTPIIIGGRNLVLGTSKQVVQANIWNMQVANINYDKSLGSSLCASVMINNADHASDLLKGSASIVLTAYDKSGNILSTSYGNRVDYNDNGLSQCSISIGDNTANVKAVILTNNMNANAYYSCLKIERGNVPTDWTPAPEDAPSNDAQLVHKTGTETVAGDKTFTGNSIFTNLIDGYTKTIETPTNDINLIKKPGKYRLQSTYLNVPTGMPNSSIMIVEDNIEHTVIYQTIITRDVDGLANGDVDMFIRLFMDTNWTPWRKLAQDQQVAHSTGNETIAGNKTFTGSNIFTQLIDGYTKTSVAPNTDVNLITKSGKYELLTSNTNVPSGMPNNAILIVENNKETGTGSDVVYQRILSRDPKNIGVDSTIFFRKRFSSTWSGWRQVARDNEVVHNTGTETIAGNKTFTGDNNFSGATTLKTGNYGLRVTTAGIQKTSDNGVTWTNI